jgi:hypothetical protein
MPASGAPVEPVNPRSTLRLIDLGMAAILPSRKSIDVFHGAEI